MTIQFDDHVPIPVKQRGVPGPRGKYGLRPGSVMSILREMPVGKSYEFEKTLGSVSAVARQLRPKNFTARTTGPKSCRVWRIA